MSDFYHSIIGAAEKGALVLTANKRLARHLMAAFDQQMQGNGLQVWPTPQIISFEGWLHRCLAELGQGWRLLEGFRARRLWERLIEADSVGSERELLQVSATAREALKAHQLSVAYDAEPVFSQLTEDQQVFSRWQQKYQDECRRHNWLDRAELPAVVFQAMVNGQLPLPQSLLLVGFDQQAPELDALTCLVKEQGGKVVQPQQAMKEGAVIGRYAAIDPQHEVLAAARWARKLLEQGATSIGVVVPDLQKRRKEVERVFRSQIDPAAVLGLQEQESRFSLSLGSPLAEQGPVHAALQILAVGYRLTIEQVSFLLRTPYLGGSRSEADKRALFDTRLRSFRQQQIGLKNLADLAAKDERAEKAAAIFSKLQQDVENSERLLPGEWAGYFAQQLQSVGWPGERSLSSSEYQMVSVWQEKLLPEFAALDPVSQPLDRMQALALLRRLAGEIEFQLEAPTGPVQVVGLLESAGLEFDHLWLMSLSEEIFPAAARPNPFLPVGVQVEKGMPHASAERELQFARNVLQRLQGASRDMVISYPLRGGDCDLRPSPLILDFPLRQPELAERQDLLSRQQQEKLQLQQIFDRQGPPLAGGTGSGGTAILRDQALCPFRAFAHFRLQASGFDSPQPGIDPITRGNLVHKALELFWREIGSQQALLEMNEQRCDQSLQQQIDAALAEYFARQAAPPAALLDIEKSRLLGLLKEWIAAVEFKRLPFTVTEMEQEHFEQIGPLQIKTIVDRVDQLVDGRKVIIDYKTGWVKSDSLLAERLLEPQLPIYATADRQSRADAVAFAQVRRGDCKLVGVAGEGDMLPKVSGVADSKQAQQLEIEDWSQLLVHWRTQLEQLATDYVAGEATVSPVDVETACAFCDLRGLCRIGEADLIDSSEEGAS
ncbi:probable DNA repair protein [Malonomonas rubra DSM 5091]|uniref:Probable DNA repair protein n=1 Tax=Malonomonas rubra DSM 5091 TaxID=1122189 RepID=A0A1M6DI94_MALRU|nr:PD-(D/E)XK nuclease family protein [Malonomonas rubra]SHI72728.1 probable DNA repair protein [Malonomonas rubra DSM 5091]